MEMLPPALPAILSLLDVIGIAVFALSGAAVPLTISVSTAASPVKQKSSRLAPHSVQKIVGCCFLRPSGIRGFMWAPGIFNIGRGGKRCNEGQTGSGRITSS